MTEAQQNVLISIIQNDKLTTEQQIYKLSLELEKLNTYKLISNPKSILESIDLEEISLKSGKNSANRINLNNDIFENYLGSVNKKELIVVAGRPAMGKTQFLVNLANSISNNHSVLYFSLDANITDLTLRFLANESGISKNLNHLNDNSSLLFNVKENFKNKKIHLVDSPDYSLFQIKEYLKSQIVQLNIEVVFIDYLQLITDKNYRIREQEISSIMKSLKALAKELNVCIIVASQLSRSVETRGGEKKPILSDLRESGSIEEFSDKVLFLYRPEYYQLTVDENGDSTINQVQIIVAKNNNANTQIINFERDPEFTRFRVKSNSNDNLTWDFKVDGL
jgi:replicative DNA helicase